MTLRARKSRLDVKNLRASVNCVSVVDGVSLTVRQGEVHALMGPNGAGKSTLVGALMGSPAYSVEGSVLLDGVDVLARKAFERSRLGLFLAFQYPREISGVGIASFLRLAYNSTHEKTLSVLEFKDLLREKMDVLGLSEDFAFRSLNEGFSGGQKKKAEMLQLLVLQPKFALLDEIDSGLDVDALKVVSKAINEARKNTGILIVTHYDRVLKHVKPDFVHVMVGGRIVESGGAALAARVERHGYEGGRNG